MLVVCAGDLVGAWGSQRYLKDYGLNVDLFSGPVTDNEVGLDYLRRGTGKPGHQRAGRSRFSGSRHSTAYGEVSTHPFHGSPWSVINAAEKSASAFLERPATLVRNFFAILRCTHVLT